MLYEVITNGRQQLVTENQLGGFTVRSIEGVGKSHLNPLPDDPDREKAVAATEFGRNLQQQLTVELLVVQGNKRKTELAGENPTEDLFVDKTIFDQNLPELAQVAGFLV